MGARGRGLLAFPSQQELTRGRTAEAGQRPEGQFRQGFTGALRQQRAVRSNRFPCLLAYWGVGVGKLVPHVG